MEPLTPTPDHYERLEAVAKAVIPLHELVGVEPKPQTPDNSCPHCGAEETNSSGLRIYWACGSHATFGCDMKPTPLCREREAHNKTKVALAKAHEELCQAGLREYGN
jgi:hypothetical protein